MNDAWSSAAQLARRTSEPARSAEQPTSRDAMNRIMKCIQVADVEDYIAWKTNNPDAKVKTLSDLVGHFQSAVKQSFQSYAEQLVAKGIDLGVLISWILVKCVHYNASVGNVKQALRRLAKSEHFLFRMKCLVESAEKLRETIRFSAEAMNDKDAVEHSWMLWRDEVYRQKNALIGFATDNTAVPEE